MRIAYFTDTYYPQINGVTYTLEGWKKELEERGHEVLVVYPESSHEGDGTEFPVPSRPIQLVDNYKLGMSFPSDLSWRLPETDVVHVHGPFTLGLLGKRVAARDSSPVFATHHTPISHYFDYFSGHPWVQAGLENVYRWWEKRFYSGVDRVLAPSAYTAGRLKSKIGREVEPLSNGIDTDFFQPTGSGFLEEHGVDSEKVIGFCGRLGYEKRLEDLVEFAERFDGEIVVAGDGFAKRHYLDLFGRRENITYLGRLDREEMPRFYTALDLFVIPSIAETQGVSVLEANACGTPAVAADALALTETVQEEVNGYRYEPGDIDDLERTVEKAYSELSELEAGSKVVARKNSVLRTVDRLEEFYSDSS